MAGRDAPQSIYKTSDAKTWIVVASRVGSRPTADVDLMTFRGNALVAGSEADSVYEMRSGGQWQALAPIITANQTDMAALDSFVFVGSDQYCVTRVGEQGGVLCLYDSLDYNCQPSTSIQQFWITKFLETNLANRRVLLASSVVTRRFIYIVTGDGMECFDRTGLSDEEIWFGAHDLAWKGDTLLAAMFPYVKQFTTGRWTTFGDSLPPTPQNFRPYATALAVYQGRVFAGTNYGGVLEWHDSLGWKMAADGLPKSPDGFYDAVSYLTVFGGKLVAAFGRGKPWPSAGTGLWILELSGVDQ